MRRTLSIVLTIASYGYGRMNEFKPVFSLLTESLRTIGSQCFQVIFNSKNLLANPVFGNFHSTTSAKQFSSFMYFFSCPSHYKSMLL